MNPILAEDSTEFLNYLEDWRRALPQARLSDLIPEPAAAGLLSVDMVNGFCSFGPLSSPRVSGIVEPVVSLMKAAWGLGMRNIALAQDTHEPDAVEFAQWPAHCVRGSAEAEAVDAIKELPFYGRLARFPKNSIHSGLNSGLSAWLESRPEIGTFIVVGDCTDLCTYQLAMHLRLDANARQIQRRVIVPANAADTYDRPVAVAKDQGGFPHPGELLHALFLYHMALNGVEVVAEIL